MYRPLDKRLHFSTNQNSGEYFGKDCGKNSLARGQGRVAGTINTAVDVYPCIIPYKERQHVTLNRGYSAPRLGERPMHTTTIPFTSAKPQYLSTTRQEFGGKPELMPTSRPHGCRSMHTSQIVFGRDTPSHGTRNSTYSNAFYDKYSEPHYKVLQPVLINREKNIGSKDVKDSTQIQRYTNYLSEYRITHNKLGAMLDISKPKHEIPKIRDLPRHYNVLTGEDIGPSWQTDNKRTSGNRVLQAAIQRENTFVLG